MKEEKSKKQLLVELKELRQRIVALEVQESRRKRAEEALKISEVKFSRAFHSNPHPMSIVTVEEGRYLDVNDSYVQTFGFSREELLGRTTVDMGIVKSGRAREEILQRLKKAHKVKNLEVELYTKSGYKIDALLSADRIEIGEQPCLLTVITDVTERKKARKHYGSRKRGIAPCWSLGKEPGRRW